MQGTVDTTEGSMVWSRSCCMGVYEPQLPLLHDRCRHCCCVGAYELWPLIPYRNQEPRPLFVGTIAVHDSDVLNPPQLTAERKHSPTKIGGRVLFTVFDAPE